ncbi:Competence protein CoiA [Peribacillus sp. Bi96]|uniref:competence protein CoiA n=1 Tax=unclassified Peribacillus TaxID=2675266 RepID=UPI001D2B7CD1|nr:competence protein CoiA family protein [Peribacillus sp. Bi96]CAH0309154.1 Competence protein CoiA [Peribacillus sp. Bi96]
MLRCITSNEDTLIASNCNVDTTKILSTKKALLCPNCKSTVIYKPGKVKRPHFAHHNSECVTDYHEPETDSHVKGKEILYKLLKSRFPRAEIEYEVYIPETKQIADVFIKHTHGNFKGLRWAIEFQHSQLSLTDWESRHNLYNTAGIQAFWILDKTTYLKFSRAKDHTDARKRNELEKKLYGEVGLCYFLDIEKEELTIDFNFETVTENNVFNRKRVTTNYTYHRPKEHAAPINKIRFRMNDEFKYSVMLFDEIEDKMNDRLIWIIKKLKREHEVLLEEELQLRIPEKKGFANTIYQDGEAHIARRFIQDNERDIAEDIRDLSDKDFFEKYKGLIDKLILNIHTFNALKKSQQLKHKIIVDLNHSWDMYKISFLVAQATNSLEEYLTMKTQDKISLVEYAYNTYKDVFEKLASRHTELTNIALKKIKWFLVPYNKNPNAIDYALVYRHCKTTKEIDEYLHQIDERIIKYNPFY